MTDDNIVQGAFPNKTYPQLEELYERLNNVILEYGEDDIPFAAIIGVLTMLQHNIINDAFLEFIDDE